MLLPEIKSTPEGVREVHRIRKARHAAFDASEPVPEHHKPRWLKGARQLKGEMAPELDKIGVRFAPPVPRGQGPTKRFAAN